MVLVLVVLVALPVGDSVEKEVVAFPCDPEAEAEFDLLAVADEVVDPLAVLVVLLFWFWFCRRTSQASNLGSRDSGHGQAREQVVKRSKRADSRGRRPEPFMSGVRGASLDSEEVDRQSSGMSG